MDVCWLWFFLSCRTQFELQLEAGHAWNIHEKDSHVLIPALHVLRFQTLPPENLPSMQAPPRPRPSVSPSPKTVTPPSSRPKRPWRLLPQLYTAPPLNGSRSNGNWHCVTVDGNQKSSKKTSWAKGSWSIIYRVLYMSGGAGSLPSTVSLLHHPFRQFSIAFCVKDFGKTLAFGGDQFPRKYDLC